MDHPTDNERDLDRIRRAALDEIDKSQRQAKLWLVGAGTFEALLFVAILWTIDWQEQLQRLIFFCALLVYAPLALGLMALRSYIDYGTQRILKAVGLGLEEKDLP